MKAVPASRYLIFLSLAVGGCALDLATKHWVFAALGLPRGVPCDHWLIANVVGLQTSLNEGALFGMGQGNWPLFAGFSLLAIVGILGFLFVHGAAQDAWLTVALGCVTAGILGNLYDRLGLPGLHWYYDSPLHRFGDPVHAVRDWVLVMIGRWPWPNFNVADSCLVCGAALLLWQAFLKAPKAETQDPKQI
jgi:signal peptidase II